MLFALLVGAAALPAPGWKVPGGVELFDAEFPPTKVNLAQRVAGKKVILVGLPGAFTPT
jgi:peroxiredoxin